MKKSFIFIIVFLLIVAWLSLGAFCIYFPEYAAFKICSFIFLLGISYFIGQNSQLARSGLKIVFFKNKLLLSIKVVLVFFIFCMLHFLNSHQHWAVDLTLQKLYQVRNASIALVKNLTAEQNLVLTFWGTREQWNEYEDLLLSYKAASSKVQLQWVDPDKNPEKATSIQGRNLPILSVEYGSKKQWVETIDEWVISVALNGLREKKNKFICFISTHQTVPIESTTEEGSSEFKTLLQSEGFTVQNTSLINKEQTNSCNILFLIGPKDDLLIPEIKLLQDYAKTIPLVIAIAPSVDKKYLYNLRRWFSQLGVYTEGSPVIDQSVLQLGEQAINVLWESQHHQIDENWPKLAQVKGRVLFQLTTAFDEVKHSDSKITPLIFSQPFPSTWQEANWDGVIAGKVTFEEKVDKKGPAALVVAIENPQIKQLVLLGTDRLWMNGLKNYPANFSLGLNIVKTLVNDVSQSTGNSVVLREEKLYLHNAQAKLIFYLSIVVMPFMMFILAFIVFRKNAAS